ncbi:protein PIN-LIKES 6 [Capsella rubella]|uniref:protein PIN-LIKES 6 n=1 Tax=Capsella rubella TaxID=81985 RepID=UPI000CD50306|nr:protein PIN-LIKES 6 [Capsella rubella]
MEIPAAAGESVLGTIKIAVMPIAKVFTMCFLGLLMASKYVNILPPSGRKLLNGWHLPNVVLGTISGSIIGFIVATIIRPPYPYFKFTIIQIGVGNIGNVPLVLLAALCRDTSNPLGDSEKCSIDGTAYISFGQWVGAIILYTYVYQMFAPPPEGFDAEEENLPLKNLPVDAAPEQVPLLTQNFPKDISPAQVRLPVQNTGPRGRTDSRKSKITQIFVFLYEKLKLKQIVLFMYYLSIR